MRTIWAVAALLMSGVAVASDYNVCASCPWDDNLLGIGGSWEAHGEALYWKADTGGFQWVRITQADPQDSFIQLLEPDYHWGFRLGGTFTSCTGCSYVNFSGLYFWGRDRAVKRSQGLSPAFIFNTPGNATQVGGRLKFDYWNLDLHAGRYLWRGSGIAMHAFVGVRYANISEKVDVSAVQQGLIADRNRYTFNGAGPELGVGGEFCIWDGLNVVGQLAGMAIIGPRKTVVDLFDTRGLLVQRIRFDTTTIIAPGVDLRLALNYSQEVCCLLFAAELGWELDHYWNVADRGPSFPEQTGRFASRLATPALQGPTCASLRDSSRRFSLAIRCGWLHNARPGG